MHPTIHPDNRSGTTGSAGADLEQEDWSPLMAPANSLNLSNLRIIVVKTMKILLMLLKRMISCPSQKMRAR